MDNQNTQENKNPVLSPETPTSPTEIKVFSKGDKLKRTFFQILIGCLIGAATIAVTAVLAGSFNEILGRALATILMVALHALLSLSHISGSEKRDQKERGQSTELFNNTVFTLIAVSFITSVFAIWQLIDGSLTLKLYMFYIILLFATLHADILYRLRGFEKKINTVISLNYILMSVVVTMLTTVIFVGSSNLGEVFYRILAAFGIVDATVTISAIIMHKLYLQKHPELNTVIEEGVKVEAKSFWKNPLVILLLIFLGFQIVGSLIALVIGRL